MVDALESIYAAQLLELGFVKRIESQPKRLPKNIEITAIDEPANAVGKEKTAPLYFPPAKLPGFIEISVVGLFEMTMVMDETGQVWEIRKKIDLEPLGFTKLLVGHPLQ